MSGASKKAVFHFCVSTWCVECVWRQYGVANSQPCALRNMWCWRISSVLWKSYRGRHVLRSTFIFSLFTKHTIYCIFFNSQTTLGIIQFSEIHRDIVYLMCRNHGTHILLYSAAAAAKLLQSCPTLCDPIDDSPRGSPSLGFSRQEHCLVVYSTFFNLNLNFAINRRLFEPQSALGLNVEWFVFEIAPKYCISDSCLLWGYSISSSKGLPTVVDIMAIWIKLNFPVHIHFISLISKMSMFTLAISYPTTCI